MLLAFEQVDSRVIVLRRPKAPPPSAKRSRNNTCDAKSFAAGVTLPDALATSLSSQPEPFPAEPVDADAIEANAPGHTTFARRNELLTCEDHKKGDSADGSGAGAEEAAGKAWTGADAACLPAANNALPAAEQLLSEAHRVVPPDAVRMSSDEFNSMQASGEFVAVHERLFRHSKNRARVGASQHVCVGYPSHAMHACKIMHA